MTDDRDLRIELLEQSRKELGDQMQHLIGLLEEAREEIRYLKRELAKERGEPEPEP
ncbi:MAG: hypothetical protein KDB80_05365 [Planctomycetes bacterium]|nr:hypothetical protein [Planctomycetota bacterium]